MSARRAAPASRPPDGLIQLAEPNAFNTADHESMDYERERVVHLFVLVPAQQYVGQFSSTFKEFPPSQKPGTFTHDRVLENLQ